MDAFIVIFPFIYVGGDIWFKENECDIINILSN